MSEETEVKSKTFAVYNSGAAGWDIFTLTKAGMEALNSNDGEIKPEHLVWHRTTTDEKGENLKESGQIELKDDFSKQRHAEKINEKLRGNRAQYQAAAHSYFLGGSKRRRRSRRSRKSKRKSRRRTKRGGRKSRRRTKRGGRKSRRRRRSRRRR
jgi:hypothetical protein